MIEGNTVIMEKIDIASKYNSSKFKGELGESLIKTFSTLESSYNEKIRLEPIVNQIHDYLGKTHPEYKETYEIQIRLVKMSELKGNYDVRGWVPDVLFKAKLRRNEMTEFEYLFPVEVKTGEYARLKGNQLEVMKELSENQEVLSLLIELDIDDLPESFGMEVKPKEH